MRTVFWAMTLLLALAACAHAPSSRQPPAVPALNGRVNDLAGMLSQVDRESISKLLAEYEAETHHQIAVLTVPTLNGERIETFTLRVANTWRLGLKGWDDGILVTLAVREHRIRIDLGSGMNRYISNAMTQEVIDRDMVPAFRAGHYAEGLRAGLLTLMAEARAYRITSPQLPPTSSHEMLRSAPKPA